MAFKEEMYNKPEAPTEVKEEKEEIQFEDGGNKTISDTLFKRRIVAFGVALYILITGLFIDKAVDEIKTFIFGETKQEDSYSDKEKECLEELAKAVLEGRSSASELSKIANEYGMKDITYEMIYAAVDEYKHNHPELGAEAIHNAIREGKSGREVEEIAKSYGITLDSNYIKQIWPYLEEQETNHEQVETIDLTQEEIKEADKQISELREQEEASDEWQYAGLVPLDEKPKDTADVKYEYQGLRDGKEHIYKKFIKKEYTERYAQAPEESVKHDYNLRMYTKGTNGSIKSCDIDEALDTPLYNQQSGRVMILRPINPNLVMDLVTDMAVTSEDYYGSSPINIYDMVESRTLVGTMGMNKVFNFASDDFVNTAPGFYEQSIKGVKNRVQ